MALLVALAAPLAGQAGEVAAVPLPVAVAVAVPRIAGRLQAAQLGLVINTDDPYSVAVGAYEQHRRGLSERQVLRLQLPRRPRLTETELQTLREQIAAFFGADIQALALAWREPFAVACQSITSAVTLGFEPAICADRCGPGTDSPLFNNPVDQPWTRIGLRPSILLAARSEEEARRMIDRGVASDATLGRLFGPTSEAVFVSTADAARNVRSVLYPPAGAVGTGGLTIVRATEQAVPPGPYRRLIAYQTGAATLKDLDHLGFLPGALADHLTSFGGVLDGSGGQSTVLDWISAGATASYGTVSEPCNHLQKFPHPQVLLLNYLQGATAIEAYWRSVQWPAQGLFVGEPLAAPFAGR